MTGNPITKKKKPSGTRTSSAMALEGSVRGDVDRAIPGRRVQAAAAVPETHRVMCRVAVVVVASDAVSVDGDVPVVGCDLDVEIGSRNESELDTAVVGRHGVGAGQRKSVCADRSVVAVHVDRAFDVVESDMTVLRPHENAAGQARHVGAFTVADL